MRQDYKDLPLLAASLQEQGQLQSVLVTPSDEHHYLLIAGGRRVAAARSLGWEHIEAMVMHNVTESQLRQLELIENTVRADMTWQESVRAFHAAYKEIKAERSDFDYKLAGALFKRDAATVSMIMSVAARIDDPKVAEAKTLREAYQVLLEETKQKALKQYQALEDARRNRLNMELEAQAKTNEESPTTAPATPSDLESKADSNSDPYASIRFQLEKEAALRIQHKDVIEFLYSLRPESVDGCLTDIPYGIEMDNLMCAELELTKAQHDVQDNVDLMHKFIPALYRVLRPDAYACLFFDLEHWQLLRDISIKAGFVPCNWPLTWVKTSNCGNQAPYHNFTKSTEVVLVLRKGSPRLQVVANQSHWSGELSSEERARFVHPFSKPKGMIAWIASKCFRPSSLIAEPFCGRGSIICALTELKYQIIGCDNVEDHINWAREEYVKSHSVPEQLDLL